MTLLSSTSMWTPRHPKPTIFGPFIQTICSISPFLVQTSYLFPILFEVSYQSKPHLRESLVLRPPPMKTIFLFYNACLSAKRTRQMAKEAAMLMEWYRVGLLVGGKANSPIAYNIKAAAFSLPSPGHYVLNHKTYLGCINTDSILCFCMTGELAEFSRESWTEEFKPRISFLKCSKDHNLSELTSLLLQI